MKKKIIFSTSILILIILLSAGCTDFIIQDGKITYQTHPTKISYTIAYGYKINCTGTGEYNLMYDCDEPEALKGTISSVTSSNLDYELKTIATFNQVRSWDIQSSVTKNYDLGISANIVSESFIIADLKGNDALTIEELQLEYPEIVSQYTNSQSKDEIAYIDPTNPDIINIVNTIDEENLFIFAKELFIWLKQNTIYQIHEINNDVQTAEFTLSCKSGDCDDLSFLYISLCRAAGIPARFIRGFLLADSIPVAHAWVEVFVGGGIGSNGWIPVECAGTSDSIDVEVHQNFGLENCEHLRVFKDDGTDESLNVSLSGFYSQFDSTRDIDAKDYAKVTDYSVLQNNKLIIDEKNGNRYYS